MEVGFVTKVDSKAISSKALKSNAVVSNQHLV